MISSWVRHVPIWSVVALSIAMVGELSTAEACGNGVEYETERGVAAIARAEALLNQGKEQLATRTALEAFSRPKRLVPNRRGLTARALRVFAVAQVRQGGILEVPGFETNSEAAIKNNLAWATGILTVLHLRSPKDAALETELAEAYAKLDEHHQEALAILQRLAKADRLTSAQGYAALARLLRNQAADQAWFLRAPLLALSEPMAQLAEQRCSRMSRGAAYCHAQPPAI